MTEYEGWVVEFIGGPIDGQRAEYDPEWGDCFRMEYMGDVVRYDYAKCVDTNEALVIQYVYMGVEREGEHDEESASRVS